MITTIKEWIRRIKDYPLLSNSLSEALETNKRLMVENIDTNNLLSECISKNSTLDKEDEMEKYWNNKRAKQFIPYKARNSIDMDVRVFCGKNELTPNYSGNYDKIVKISMDWVKFHIEYSLLDEGVKGEFWKFPFETVNDKRGDCEDQAILLHSILITNGIPYYRLRLNAGWVKVREGKGGHCWLTYLAEDNEWYVIDTTFWFNESKDLKLKWKEAEKYLEVWFSWNRDYIFGDLPKIEAGE